MNLHITPSFNLDRPCKTASVLLFLVQNLKRNAAISLAFKVGQNVSTGILFEQQKIPIEQLALVLQNPNRYNKRLYMYISRFCFLVHR